MTMPEGISLGEAIKKLKVLSLAASISDRQFDAEFEVAAKLGIEALKRIENIRNEGNVMPGSLLPGEIEK